MDEWKRTYSNEDTEKVAIPYFWKNFDKENYSVWYCEYTEDLSDMVTFQVCNLVSGENLWSLFDLGNSRPPPLRTVCLT